MRLAVERLSRVLHARWTSPLGPERFTGMQMMEDLPVYRLARALFRRAGKVRVRTWVQRVSERPEGMDSQMAEKVPQFFLRNIARAERVLDDEMPFDVIETRDREAEKQLLELRSLRYRPPAFLKRWNLDEVLWLRAMLKRHLYQEDWRLRFGRELKETIQGPLFRYDPDRSGKT